MRFCLPLLALLLSATGCQSDASTEPTRFLLAKEDPVVKRVSPDGRASLVYIDVDTPRLDRVLLVADGDTTTVLECGPCKSLGIKWRSADLGEVWVPWGNYTYDIVYVEPSSGRVSTWLEFAVAVDSEAETVVTFDPEAVTLRALWSGEPKATWIPDRVSIYDLRHQCEPSFTLTGQSATMRYDCGEGVREQEAVWEW